MSSENNRSELLKLKIDEVIIISKLYLIIHVFLKATPLYSMGKMNYQNMSCMN